MEMTYLIPFIRLFNFVV